MNSSTKRLPKTTDKIQGFILWVVATSWIWTIGPSLWILFGVNEFGIQEPIETGLFLCGGIFIGLGQWLILRRFGISRWWIAATAFGWTLCWFELLGLLVLMGGGDFFMGNSQAPYLLMFSIFPGITLGVLQSFILRDMRIRWILATMIGWAIGLPLSLALSQLLPQDLFVNMGPVGIGTCISVGVATGVVLLQLKARQSV